VIRLVDGKCGVDPVRERLHRLAHGWRPHAVELTFVAPHPGELALQLTAKPDAVCKVWRLLLRRPECDTRREPGKLGRGNGLIDLRRATCRRDRPRWARATSGDH